MKLFNKYLKEQIGVEGAKNIFLSATKDYLKGEIKLTELSAIAVKLYFEIFSASDFGGGELHTIIEKTADIDYAIKKAEEGDEKAKKEVEDLIIALKSLSG